MKKRITLLGLALFSIGVHAQSGSSPAGADMIVFHAIITTQAAAQPEATALAVKGGRIYAVGNDIEILAMKDSKTRVIDAQGRRLIPGIEDSHIHPLNERNFTHKVRWDGVPTLKRALEMLKEQAARTPEGQWVRVTGGWSPYQFAENRMPTPEELSKAVPNRPLLIHYAYNWGFLNKQAMKVLGVGTAKFQMPEGTNIHKDKKGHYTGVITGNTFAFIALEGLTPGPTPEEEVSSLEYVINYLNRFGITSVIECASIIGYPEGHAPLRTLIEEHRLNVRFPFVDLGLDMNPNSNWVDNEINRVTKAAPISPGQNLHPTMEHGYEYEGTGELLRAELHDHENFDEPAVIIPKEVMMKYAQEDLRKLIQKRIPFRMHVTYNENMTTFLDALEQVNLTTPLDGMRWSVEHAETISPENIERVKKLKGGIALDTKMAFHGDAFAKTHGREKALYTPRLRALVDSGVPLSMTSDGFRVSPANPWLGLSWMVTGKSVSGSVILAEDNRLTREEALRLYTTGAAWFESQEQDKGRIAPGNLADFTLLTADYFAVPEDEIKNITAVLTVVGGRVVYGIDNYANLAPQLPEAIPSWSPIKYFGGYYGEK
ncbi:exoenzymes regulatory protein AepA precursor [Flavobacterium rivuli WB 3.3-2 = DSM 21788]|uniref:Exoenzymes regulatory protein AepA n=2 Tax=Flavobacterium rivuli TaxID=498301 RepID=A0A0A2M9Z2_9FLAO|nr:exoenzymes regulatory protein AepA precursor [Flavobacterium rivuli WB 3.3-2 = DSM 21788]